MTTHEREQLFGIGITLGVVVGFVVGSLLAMWLGESVLDSAGDLLNRIGDRKQRTNFELLLQ